MSFENITFKNTNVHANPKINTYAAQKISTLEKYVAPGVEARAEVEFERVASHRSGAICRTEVNVTVAGTLYRAEATEETFEAAIDAVRAQLDHEMRKAHKKRTSLFRQGGRKIKEMMQFWG